MRASTAVCVCVCVGGAGAGAIWSVGLATITGILILFAKHLVDGRV